MIYVYLLLAIFSSLVESNSTHRHRKHRHRSADMSHDSTVIQHISARFGPTVTQDSSAELSRISTVLPQDFLAATVAAGTHPTVPKKLQKLQEKIDFARNCFFTPAQCWMAKQPAKDLAQIFDSTAYDTITSRQNQYHPSKMINI